MSPPIRLDGSAGGGDLVRTALSLSLATSRPFLVENLGDPPEAPGLNAGLLACIRAAQTVCGANVEGAQLGSARLLFEPGPLRAGRYLFDAGAGGAVAPLLQLLSVPLGLALGSSTLKLTGLTHCEPAPAMPWVSLIWLPVLRDLGHELDIEMDVAGFAPEGGGEVTVAVRPASRPRPIDRRGRGTLREARVLSTVSNLPFGWAVLQSERALQRLREAGIQGEAENLPVRAPRSSGLCCLVVGTFERGVAGFSALASTEADCRPAADRAAGAFAAFLRSRGGVDEGLAVQLLVPLALAAAGRQGDARPISRLAIPETSERLLATASTIEQFLEVEVAVLEAQGGAEVEIRIAPRAEGLVAALKGRR
jgi:RNA 3'-terminal phosphate cyclase (ATP)